MAGHARYTALLDACVLFPLAICDALMSVASTGLYAPKWSLAIEAEWTRSLEEKTGKPPGTALAPFGLLAIHPDEFLIAQMDLDQLSVLAAFKEMRLRLNSPAYTPEHFADAMERNALAATAQRLREAAALI